MEKITAKFSFIVPVKEINPYVRETVLRIQGQFNANWEVFIVTDFKTESEWPNDLRIKVLNSGAVGPAEKRDQAARHSQGEVLIFLDDDSFPDDNFLSVLSNTLKDDSIVAIGGPGITPSCNTGLQKASGATFETKWLASDPGRYLSYRASNFVDDWPTVNFSIRKAIFFEVGGFDSKFWPGEDTEFCLKLKKHGYRILYNPFLIVYHHRRSSLVKHLVQVGGYGLHRGFFARKYPENSRKTKYFIPSFFVLYLLVFPLFYAVFPPFVALFPLLLYVTLLIYYVFQTTVRHNIWIAFISVTYLILGHLYYGIRFLQGMLLKKRLDSKLR
jgi:glycosyltransferase involved in cell wall biosynthesis